MAKNQRAWIVLRFHQSDKCMIEAQTYLASIYATLQGQHPELCPEILEIIIDLEGIRAKIRDAAIPKFTRTPRNLHKPGHLATIVSEAKPLPSPHYASQDWERQRSLPHNDPAHRKRLRDARKARKALAASEE